MTEKLKNDVFTEKRKNSHPSSRNGVLFIIVGLVALFMMTNIGGSLIGMTGGIFELVFDFIGLVFGFIGGMFGLVFSTIGTIIGTVMGLVGAILGLVFGTIGTIFGLVFGLLGLLAAFIPVVLIIAGVVLLVQASRKDQS